MSEVFEDDTAATPVTTARVSALFVHPLKSASAISVNALELDARGATGDRRWMLVDGNGQFITAREQHRLVLIKPSFADSDRNGALTLETASLSRYTVRVPHSASVRTVRIFQDDVAAQDAGDQAAEWCSEAMGSFCRLVYLAASSTRPLQRKYAGPLAYENRTVAFCDGAPLLLLGSASIDALNARLVEQGGDAVTVARFRPNVLLDHTTAHEEDLWSDVSIGDVRVGVGSRCLRCVLTTVDPITAEGGVEPLRTLASYRRDANGVVFGMNATHAAPGVTPSVIRIGDRVRVHALRAATDAVG